VKDQVSHVYKTTCNILVLCIYRETDCGQIGSRHSHYS
jgi:hypothetical protein